jgi:hypothetical protein
MLGWTPSQGIGRASLIRPVRPEKYFRKSQTWVHAKMHFEAHDLQQHQSQHHITWQERETETHQSVT